MGKSTTQSQTSCVFSYTLNICVVVIWYNKKKSSKTCFLWL